MQDSIQAVYVHKSKLKLQFFYQKFPELSDFPSNQVKDFRYGCVRTTPRFLPSNTMCLCVCVNLIITRGKKRKKYGNDNGTTQAQEKKKGD